MSNTDQRGARLLNCPKCSVLYDQKKSNARLCVDCKRDYDRARRKKRREAANPVWSGKHKPETKKAYNAEYSQRPDVKARTKERLRHPENLFKNKARQETAKAIKMGILKREPCEVCGDKKSEAHHEDYNAPLLIRWLCRKHHMEHHQNLYRQSVINQVSAQVAK